MRFEINRRFLLIAGGLLVLLFFLGLGRDLLLEKQVVSVEREQPPVLIEGLDVVRDVEGDRWHVKAETVEKKDTISDAGGLDVVIDTSDGMVWTVVSDRGKIFEASNDIHLESATGRVKSPDRDFGWTAPRAEWDNNGSTWTFPDGFQVEDEKILISGKNGSMSMAGELIVEEGAVVTWKEADR